jgi:D-beta-D-heptose 7-phosphate kinase/D-beta-D-heptose 1-phosphate adenosyltransferase
VHQTPIFFFRNESDRHALTEWRSGLTKNGQKLVFTNGVFDLLHAGHVSYLAEARNLGDGLLIGLNADESVRRLKGPNRPIQTEFDRALLLAALKCTSAVAIFDSDTPYDLIEHVLPDILVKGGDWAVEQIVGRDLVEKNGGRVLPLPFVAGLSTTGIVENILARYGNQEKKS